MTRLEKGRLESFRLLKSLRSEIERLEIDKEAISQTASDYLHEIEQLREAAARNNQLDEYLAQTFRSREITTKRGI
jgi:hypothetical protein